MTAPRQYYDDGLIQLDREAITLRRYHFPSGTSKVIPLRSIRGYKAEPLGLFTQRFRIWGSSDLRRWLPLDVWRPIKSTLVTLDVPGVRPKPAFTPQRPKEFLARLDELLELVGAPSCANWGTSPRASLLSGYFLGSSTSVPTNGTRASGTRTLPSGC